jgi:histidinol-phosphatase (PHP family)
MTDPIYYDSHMHTPLCKHAYGEPEEYAERALKSGLKGIIFTCHSPMPRGFWPQVRMSIKEFPAYVAMVKRAAEAFAGRLDIRLGMESDFFPGFEDWIAELHSMEKFHYCLGSVHWQGIEYREKFETGSVEDFFKTYFRLLAESAETGLFDCLAHPDLVKNYKPEQWDFNLVRPMIAEALDRIARTGVAMELNTSGLNKRYSAMNPGPEMLQMMAERGIPVVIGSDSHIAQRVGDKFSLAISHLRSAGYNSVRVYEERWPKVMMLDDIEHTVQAA